MVGFSGCPPAGRSSWTAIRPARPRTPVSALAYQKHSLAVRLFAAAVRVSARLSRWPRRMTPPPFRLVQLGSAFWQSRALYVAARLDIATVLGDERLTAGDIASRVSAKPDPTLRLLRFLAALGVFEQQGADSFRNNALSDYLRTDHPRSVRAMILMHNAEEMARPWMEDLEAAVREGSTPFVRAHGAPLYAYMDSHPEFDALFAAAMDSVEALTGDSFATDFEWGRFDRLIDVGGSKGSKALAILKRYPRLRALVVDREGVVRNAAEHWRGREEARLLERVAFQAGDVFAELPAAVSDRDVYLLSGVLHGFDDEECVRALRNLASVASAAGAAIVLLELIMDERPDAAAASMDMQMFMGTRGRERTRREWHALFARSGLVLEEEVGLRSFVSLQLLRPASSAR